MLRSAPMSAFGLLVITLSGSLFCACSSNFRSEPAWPPLSKQWFERGQASFKQGDLEDAEVAAENALRITPQREEVRLLAARIALAKLEYDRVLQLLTGLNSSDARAVRGRAYWYSGEVDSAADELERLVEDPSVRDPWATDIARLARRGTGRKPFELSGGILAATDMPHADASSLIVPLDVNGEPALGLIATGTTEVEIDAKGSESSWISLRFGDRVEVRDVPALAKDLSGISRHVNAPIKVLLGVNLLRHIHPTFDFAGGQFVVRSFEPPPPPHATTVKLNYVRGGAMLLRGAFGSAATAPQASLLVDTSRVYPLALDDMGWKKAGVSLSSLRSVPNAAPWKQGILPMLRLGAFDVPSVAGVFGDDRVQEHEQGLGVELDGLVGAGLLASFRVTLADGGRTMWLEEIPQEAFAPAEDAFDEAVLDGDADSGDTGDDTAPASSDKPKLAPGSAPKAAPAPAAPAVTGAGAPKSAPGKP